MKYLSASCIGRARLAVASLSMAWACAGHALSLTPIESELSPSGRGASQIIRLQNPLTEPMAVEIDVKGRAMGLQGEDILSDATDDFTVFPTQVVLQPGQSQSVRVQYIGPPVTQERAFRLIAEQLPVDVGQPPQNGGRMRVLVKYVASMYVKPAASTPQVRVKESKIVAEAGKRWLEMLLVNEGNAHKIMRSVGVTAAGEPLAAEALKGLEGENLLAGTARVFRVPAPASLTGSAPDVQLSFR
jgi:fimbrial chaperone protein